MRLEPATIIEPEIQLKRKRLYNKKYHQRRWAIDAEYRDKKRAAANRQRLDPEYNLKRRQLRAKNPELRAREIERARQWALAFPERVKNYQLKIKYGLTSDDLRRILLEQNNSCKICLRPFSSSKPFKIDHCHKGNIVRGLLCNSCNTALGKFQDDPAVLRRAAEYVER